MAVAYERRSADFLPLKLLIILLLYVVCRIDPDMSRCSQSADAYPSPMDGVPHHFHSQSTLLREQGHGGTWRRWRPWGRPSAARYFRDSTALSWREMLRARRTACRSTASDWRRHRGRGPPRRAGAVWRRGRWAVGRAGSTRRWHSCRCLPRAQCSACATQRFQAHSLSFPFVQDGECGRWEWAD